MALLRPGKVEARLPEIGRIFKGGPKEEKTKRDGSTYRGFGPDLDYFRFEPSDSTSNLPSPDGSGTLAEYLVRQYAELGDNPRTLPIQFLYAESDKNFAATYNEAWQSVGGVERCVRRCNGETQILHLEGKVLSKEPIPCAAEGLSECPLKCKPTGRLSFILPQLKYPGRVVMTTHSIYDILEIQGNLALYEGWELNKIPFQLCRTERSINRNMPDGNIQTMKKWLCHLVIDPRFGQRLLESAPNRYLAELEGTIEDDVIEAKVLAPSVYLSQDEFQELANLAKQMQLSSQEFGHYLMKRYPGKSRAEIPSEDFEDIFGELGLPETIDGIKADYAKVAAK
ncbi:MAG: hypothetical protein ACRC62_21900 [Microcoleus sp.]